MNTARLKKVLNSMEEKNLYQMIVSDPFSIYYLTGNFIEPGERFLALYINLDGNNKLILNELFPQEKDPGVEIIWYNDIEDGVEKLSKYVKKEKIMGIDKNLGARFLIKLMDLGCGKSYINSSPIIDYIRQIKDKDEIEKMKASSLINDEVMKKTIPLVNQGYKEEELNMMVRKFYKEMGCENVSFTPITSFGINGADPHHSADESVGSFGDSVVIDIGGIKDSYCSDMTRTVFLGTVSEKQKEVFEIVKEANKRGLEAAKPGNRMKDVDLAARDYIEKNGYGKYFTHRTGHSIGLEDHEFGDVSSVNDDIIKPGQIFSVEPGIYLKDYKFGVRIEDLVLITETGNEILNKVPRDLIVLPFE